MEMSQLMCHRASQPPRVRGVRGVRAWLALVACAWLLIGCGNLALSAGGAPVPFGDDTIGKPPPDGGTEDAGAGGGLTDSGTPDQKPASPTNGSPLCGILSSSPFCDPGVAPDPSATRNYPCAREAADATDGGLAAYADAGVGAIACHVTQTPDAGATPACFPAGPGTDGSPCMTGTDCAAGFECIGDATSGTDGVCRPYCCHDTCDNGIDAGAGGGDAGPPPMVPGAYCDIQPVYKQTYSVPVCVNTPPCTLFGMDCGPGQTCTIVDAMGRTACESIGPGKSGDECETQHCGDGFACWGSAPNRTCAQLCRTAYAMCPAGQVCAWNPTNFPTMDYGVCQAAGP
jgi:hypothetical protein